MSATITDVIFDYCDVLLDWRPRIPLEGQYPPGVIDMFFSADDPHGFRYYDRLSDSGWDEERILKPDPEIYRRAIARFGVDPAATLFVDDKPANVEAARGLGLNGEVFGGVDRLRRSHYLDVP